MTLIYWIKFDNMSKPERIVAKDQLELQDIIGRLVTRYQMPYEWIVRDYK